MRSRLALFALSAGLFLFAAAPPVSASGWYPPPPTDPSPTDPTPTDPTSPPAGVPEIDAGSAAIGFAILCGLTLIVGDRLLRRNVRTEV